MVEWRFPSNDYGENKGINDSGVALFRGTPLKSLAREICQNSLDAAIGEKTIVEFNMFQIPSVMIPGSEQLKDTFNRCLEFWNGLKSTNTQDFFKTALDTINDDMCTFLRISDFQTTGLKGSREEINTDWTNLTKSSGSSDKKSTAGGSYGIGKFAPFACSNFSTVFYSTYNIDEERASQGVARLVTFTREDNQNTQGIGYFGNEKNTPVYEEMQLDPNFKRANKEYGTDIYIAGYKYGKDNWQKELIISVLDGFLGAIWDEKLEVIIGDICINKRELGNIINQYNDELTGYCDKYYNVLSSKNTMWYTEDFFGLGEVKLGLLLEDQDCPNRIAMIRKTGMKIMDKDRLPGHLPIMGVMFINGNKINEQLRAIENPEHTRWEPERAVNKIKATQLLKSINEYIKSKIEELISQNTSEETDAAGVGVFIPDDTNDDDRELNKEEIVSDRITNVEIQQVKRKSILNKNIGKNESRTEGDKKGHLEPEGTEEEWFHTGGHTIHKNERPSQEAHLEPEGSRKIPSKISVGVNKFIYICVDKEKGKYMLRLVPETNGSDGVIELYLSGETQKYKAPIKNLSLIGGNADFVDNKIIGLTFENGKELRFSLELDYSDYCSLEVEMHAIEK